MELQNRLSHSGKEGSAVVELRLLGPLLVQVDGAPVALAARKARGLLAYLALRRDEAVPRETLTGLLWSERGEEQARASLRQTLSALRKALGDARAALVASNESITLAGEAVWIDVEALQGCAEATSPDEMTKAAALYRGELLEGLSLDEPAFEQWLTAERERLRMLLCQLLSRLVDSLAANQRIEEAITQAARLLTLDPLQESVHRTLMRLYLAQGRHDAALSQFEICRRELADVLGVTPEKATLDLVTEIKARRRRGGDGAFKAPEPKLHGTALPQDDKPAIVVLPFNNLSGDPDQEYFADGITEDIISAFSRYRGLLVTSRYSAFAYKGQSADVRRVAAELDVDYVIEGSVRKAGNRVRIAAQLTDGISGKHIWAERYDRNLEDVFALQDQITETIVARIEPEIGTVEGRRAKQKPPQNLDTWGYYHLGLARLYKFTKDDNAEAQRLFHRSIELDPGFATAQAWFAYAIVLSMTYFDADPEPETLDVALDAAQKGVALDDQDAVAHFTLGRVHLARCEYDLAVAELETSIQLNPCLAQSHCGLGDALTYDGRPQEAIAHFEEAIRLSPKDPYRWGFFSFRSLAHLFLREHEAAAEWASRAARIPNAPYWSKAHLVTALGHLGRTEEAKTVVHDILRQNPEFSCSFARKHLFYIKDSTQLDHYLDGLRTAGVPR